jgi:hypothetical protein
MKNFFLLLVLAGCQGKTVPASIPDYPTGPITVAQWKELPKEIRYAPESLERLKEGVPTLRSDRGWDQFYKTVLGPARRADGLDR